MKEFLRKVWFFGLGAMHATREKVEDMVEELVKRGEVSQQDSPQIVDEVLTKAREAQKALVEKIREALMEGDIKLARAADLEALEKRVAALEEKIKDKSGS